MKLKTLCAIIAGCSVAATAGLMYLAATYKLTPEELRKEEIKYEFQDPDCILKAKQWRKHNPFYINRKFTD